MSLMKPQEKIALVVAIGVPIAMVILLFLAVKLPSLGTSPQYDFVYATNENSLRIYEYQVDQQGSLSRTETNTKAPGLYQLPESTSTSRAQPLDIPRDTTQYYYYHMDTRGVELVEWVELTTFDFFPEETSPDGYRVSQYADSSVGFPFLYDYNTDGRSLTVQGNNQRIRLEVELPNRYSSYQFIGWVNDD